MEFNSREKYSDEEYSAFIGWLVESADSELRNVMGDKQKMREVITEYVEKGYSAHLSPGELVDFYCVSWNGVLEGRDFTDDEFTLAVELFDEIEPIVFTKHYPNAK
jgi:hypothetical protein